MYETGLFKDEKNQREQRYEHNSNLIDVDRSECSYLVC